MFCLEECHYFWGMIKQLLMMVEEMVCYVPQYSGCKITYFLNSASGQRKYNQTVKAAKGHWDLSLLINTLCYITD